MMLSARRLLHQGAPWSTRHSSVLLRSTSLMAPFGSVANTNTKPPSSSFAYGAALAALATATAVATASSCDATSSSTCQCEGASISISSLTNDEAESEIDTDALPTFAMSEVAQHNGTADDGSVWMTYGGFVYDVTNFVANHPGGSDKIMLAAGGAIEPHWHGTCGGVFVVWFCLLQFKMVVGTKMQQLDALHSFDAHLACFIFSSCATHPRIHQPC